MCINLANVMIFKRADLSGCILCSVGFPMRAPISPECCKGKIFIVLIASSYHIVVMTCDLSRAKLKLLVES